MVASTRLAKKAAITVLFAMGITNLLRFRTIYTPGKAIVPTGKTLSFEVSHHETTIIISSSLIPSHPSLELINHTISSLRNHIQGLPLKTPIIITVDGVKKKGRNDSSTAQKKRILDQYIHALRTTYHEPHITILQQKKNINLVGNLRKAMPHVDTEFVYVIQHDMPFISTIDHRALVQTFRDYPNEVRLVRFSPRTTLSRNRDKMGLCGPNIDFDANGIALAKTHTWSDNNHFTRKSYYDEMFSTIAGWDDTRFMETKMNVLGAQNCSYWGTYLYGKQGTGPAMIVHMNGRKILG